MLTPAGFRDGWDVCLIEGRIAGIGAGLPAGDEELDAAGLYVLPGFVDVHVHGAGGTSEPRGMARFLPRTGVTAFLPTLATSSPADTLGFVRDAAACEPEEGTAEVLGSHLEGPYLSPDRCGAQPAEHVRACDVEEVDRLLEAAEGSLRRVTLAPELPGARQVVERLTGAGVQVSLGHSACSYRQAMEAAGWGATSITHTYNAMAPFHHREPGLVGAALARPELLAELIADGVHVHPAAALALIQARGAGSVAAVTDGLPPVGLPAGSYDWLGRRVTSDGAAAYLDDGTLAGSATPMDQALRNLVSWGVALEDAARMAARTGAILAGAAGRKGALVAGFDADLVLLDRSLQVAATYCRAVRASLSSLYPADREAAKVADQKDVADRSS